MRNIVQNEKNSLTVLKIEKETIVSKFLLENQLTLNKKLNFGSVVEISGDELIMSRETVLLQAPSSVYRKLTRNDQISLDNDISDSFKTINFRSGYEYFYVSISKDEMSFEEACNSFSDYFLYLSTQPYIIYETKYETVLVIWLFLGNDFKTYKSFYGEFLKNSNEKEHLEFSFLENSEIQVKHKLFHKMSTLNWQEGFCFDNFDDDSVSFCTMYVFNTPCDENGNAIFELPVTRLLYTQNSFYDNLLLEFENAHVEEMQKIRDDYKIKQITNYQKALNLETFEEAFDKWNYFINSNCIPSGMELKSIDDEILSLSDILKNPSIYNGKMFQDPINGVTDRFNALLDLSNPSEPSLLIESTDLQQTRLHFGLDAETFLLMLSIFNNEYLKSTGKEVYYKQLGRLGTLSEHELKIVTNHYLTNNLDMKGFKQFYLFKDYDVDSKGKILATEDTFEKFIKLNNYDLFYDPIKKGPVLLGGSKTDIKSHDVMRNFRKGLTNLELNADKMIRDYFDNYAFDNPKNYLWEKIYTFSRTVTEEDNVEFEKFLNCFHLESTMDRELFSQIMELLLIHMVAVIDGAEHSPIKHKFATFEYIFVLIGVGGIKKSKVFENMFNSIGAENYFLSNALPDFSEKAKDLSYFNYAFVEIAECEQITLNKKLLENTKRIVSRSQDDIYDKKTKSTIQHQRHTMFLGTTNENYFVMEKLNLRRFVTIPVKGINETMFDVDYSKLLGMFVKKYLNGARWWFDKQYESDMELTDKIELVTLNHHPDGEIMLMAREVFKRTLSTKSLMYVSAGEMWVALKNQKADETQIKKFAKALRTEGIRQSETTFKFHVSECLYNDYNKNIKLMSNLSE